jgi:hypothetical protein
MLRTTGQSVELGKGLLCAEFRIHAPLVSNFGREFVLNRPKLRRLTCFLVQIAVFLVLLKAEATGCSEVMVTTYRATRYHSRKYRNLHFHRRENLMLRLVV